MLERQETFIMATWDQRWQLGSAQMLNKLNKGQSSKYVNHVNVLLNQIS